jgi:hypothetical protein
MVGHGARPAIVAPAALSVKHTPDIQSTGAHAAVITAPVDAFSSWIEIGCPAALSSLDTHGLRRQ